MDKFKAGDRVEFVVCTAGDAKPLCVARGVVEGYTERGNVVVRVEARVYHGSMEVLKKPETWGVESARVRAQTEGVRPIA